MPSKYSIYLPTSSNYYPVGTNAQIIQGSKEIRGKLIEEDTYNQRIAIVDPDRKVHWAHHNFVFLDK